MSNPRNHGSVIGRLAGDPKVFTNNDGSKKVLFSVYADHDYTNDKNERGSDIVPLEAFVRATTNGTGPFANIHQGDQVAVEYRVRQDRFTRGGSEVFETKLIVTDITYLEPRSVTQARLNERVAKVEADNRELQSQTAQPAAAPAATPAAATSAATSAVDEQLPF